MGRNPTLILQTTLQWEWKIILLVLKPVFFLVSMSIDAKFNSALQFVTPSFCVSVERHVIPRRISFQIVILLHC